MLNVEYCFDEIMKQKLYVTAVFLVLVFYVKFMLVVWSQITKEGSTTVW